MENRPNIIVKLKHFSFFIQYLHFKKYFVTCNINAIVFFSVSNIKQNNKGVFLELSPKQRKLIHTDNRPCSTYSSKEFLHCSKASFWKHFARNISCQIFNFKEFIIDNDGKLPNCTTKESAAEVTFTSLWRQY